LNNSKRSLSVASKDKLPTYRRGELTSIRSGLRVGREGWAPLRALAPAFVVVFPKNAAIRCQNVFFGSFASSR
jgi:hypothetical protein